MTDISTLRANYYKAEYLRSLPRPAPVVVVDTPTTFDYYVDSVNGDDNNHGRYPQYAFQTIAKLSTVLTQPGMSAALVCGSHWREQLTLSCANLIVGTYGTGVDPILDASDIITGFVPTAGTANVFEKAVATSVDINNYINGWEDGTFLTRAVSVANCDATPGSHYPTANSGAITWYIHPINSDNPNTNEKTYEVSTRKYGLYSAFASVTLSDFETRNNQSDSGSLVVSRSATLNNIICRNGGKHNLYFHDGAILNGVQALNCYHHSSSMTLFVWNENTPIGLGITFNDCIADGGTVSLAGCTGYYGHKNISGDFGTITFNRCISRNVFVGWEPVDCVAVLNDCVSDVTVNTVLRPWCASTTLTDCALSSNSFIIEFQGVNQHITVSGGTFTIPNPGASRNAIVISAPYTGVHLVLNGVTINNLSLPYPNTILNYAANTTIDVHNCTWLAPGLSCYAFISIVGMTINSDYNTFKNPSTWYLNPNGYTFAQWQVLGYDAHSTNV
jgi:hypothetical protein